MRHPLNLLVLRARILLASLLGAACLLALPAAPASASVPCAPAADLLSIFPGFPLALPAPTQASCFEGFDGNQIVPAAGHTGHVDWQQIVANAAQYEFVSVADDGGDSTFASDDKENDPGTWNIDPAGSVPNKVNALAAATATDPVSNKTFVYAAFQRLENVGNVFISFELNKLAAGPGQFAPPRSEGDVMISYEGTSGAIEVRMCKWHGDAAGESSNPAYGWYSLPGFGAPGAVKADSGSGDCTLLSGATAPTGRGALNTAAIANHIPGMGDPNTKKSDITAGSNQLTSIAGGTATLAVGNVVIGPGIPGGSTITSIVNPSTVQISSNATVTGSNKDVHYMPNTPNTISDDDSWGEAVVNLTDALQAGGVSNPCFDFGSVWLHTRSSASFTNSMQDLIRSRPLQGAKSCALDVDKKVATQKAGDATPPAIQTITADTINGFNLIDGAFSTANMDVGDRVSGPGIPAGSTITSIVDADSITISNNATATATGVSLVVNPYHEGTPADPSFAAAGDTLHYLLTVTNPGQTPIAAVSLSDTNCTGEVVSKQEGPNNTGALFLDPGDVWTYTCTAGPLPNGTVSPVNNTGTVTGQVGVGICPQPIPSQTYSCLTDADSVATTLRGSVSGVKFHDLNADGDQDGGEPGLVGWNIYADLNDNDSKDPSEPEATTGAGGAYTITNLAAGTHTIREVQQGGWNCSTPDSTAPANVPVPAADCEQDETVVGGADTAGPDFGNYQDVAISGVKFHDPNANGVDDGEVGLTGWNVYVDYDGSNTKDPGEPEATTGAGGLYSINGVKPGTYDVREIQQAGWHCSTPNAGAGGIPVAAADCEAARTFTSGVMPSTVKFGNYQNVSISGVKFHDLNADGDQDGGEPGLTNWNIYVDLDGSNTKDAGEPEANTGAGGAYTINGVKPGTYAVREVQQGGWNCSTPGSPPIPVAAANCEASRTFTSGATPSAVDFGNYQDVSISGVKFHDLNADGDQDGGEPGLTNWNIYVDYDGSDTKDAGEPEATTGAGGAYTINGVKPGTYAVREVQQAGWNCSTPDSAPPADIPVAAAQCEDSRTFTSGDAEPALDFGNYQNVALSGVKFHDQSANGARGASEPGLGGWNIYVDYNGNDQKDAGEPEATTSNDADPNVKGTYTISGIKPGQYAVREVQQANWHCSTPGSPAPVSDANCEAPRTFTSGQASTDVVFGNYQNVDQSGVKFHDLNANGSQDGGEPGLTGWNIYVDLNGNNSKDAGEPDATTGAGGAYTITGIMPGTYAVREVQQASWHCSTPGSSVPADIPVSGANCEDSQTYTSGQQSSAVDFGNYQNVSQSGVKFHDENANGTQDGGEPGLTGWNIYVDLNGNDSKDAGEPDATTGAGGAYTINGIKPGTYAVREVQQGGWNCSTPGSPIPVSAANCEDSQTYTSGQQSGAVDFGNYQNVSISGVKFHDLNANGTQDGGEPGLTGWNIYVDLDGNDSKDAGEPDATTGAGGAYTINGVKPGAYDVREVQQAGWNCSTPGSPIPVAAANCEAARTFTSGATPNAVDFGNYQNVSISGVKFHDLNADGDQDGGEPGLTNWNVYVDLDGNNSKDAGEPDATTGAGGAYTISGVKPGAYDVREVQQAGWNCSTPGSTVPADIPVADANCEASRTFVSGATPNAVDFGNYQNVSISGVKFHDLNANGSQDGGEPGLTNWNIYVDLNGNDSKDAGEPDATTGAGGAYTISGVKPGQYDVREVQQAGWNCSTPGSPIPVAAADCEASRTFVSGGTPNAVDFGNYQNVSVSGVKFHDLNANGTQDGGEPGLTNWNIYVDLDGNNSKDAGEPDATTGAGGAYTISGIKPGTYAVREVQQAGWNCSTPGSNAPADIPVSGANCESSQTFTSGQASTDVTFGNYQNVSVAGVKFHDLNANGSQDGGEPGLTNWNIYVDLDGNNSKDAGEPDATTGAGGAYTINGVKPGQYAVREVQQAGWHCSAPNSGAGGIPVAAADCEQSRTFTSGATPGDVAFGDYQDGTIQIAKVNQGGAAGDQFTFDTSAILRNNSTTGGLAGDGSFQRQGGQTQTFTSVKPNTAGDYTVDERSSVGYRLTALSCGDQDSTPQNASDANGLQNRQSVIKVSSGETVTCTYTNKAIFSSNLVVKAGNEFAYHGDTLTFTFAVTNTGDGPLSDVHVTDDRCSSVSNDPTSKQNDNGDAFLDPSAGDPTPETWVFTCTMPVPNHSSGEENPIVNTATASARDEFLRLIQDTDQHSTRILHQAIDIEKEGPVNATAGDLVPYTLTVTNPGDTAFPAADVTVTDPQCTAPPALQVKNRGAGTDPSPDTLDPGDAWVYGCSVQTSAGQQRIDNVATVNGRDSNGRDASDNDTAVTVLGEQQVAGEQVEPGTARLAGRSGCVAKAFYVTVRGRQIRSVTFHVDGKKRATLTSPDKQGRYRLKINPRKLKPGAHRAVASVKFTEASNTRSKKMNVRFRRCVRRTAPAFTG